MIQIENTSLPIVQVCEYVCLCVAVSVSAYWSAASWLDTHI